MDFLLSYNMYDGVFFCRNAALCFYLHILHEMFTSKT